MRPYPRVVLAAWLLLAPAIAKANPEPTAYDSRSVGLGLTGVTYLERPSAIAINPANLEGVEKFGFTLLFNPLVVLQTAPVEGPNTSKSSGAGFGPLGSFFIAGRVAPRAVIGLGLYIETGYGSGFDDIGDIDGAGQNLEPEKLEVVFFVGEAAVASSFRVNSKLNLGVALRFPFSVQTADLYTNLGAALGSGIQYGSVKNDLKGIGFPSGRFGLTYKPTSNVTLSAAYRAYSKIPLKGTAETDLAGLENLQAESSWNLPHALQAGGAFRFLERKLMLVLEGRFQFHDAKRSGNSDQTVTTSNPTDPGNSLAPLVIPFNWRTVYSAKVAVEYSVSDLIDLRAGFNAALSATRQDFAQYFTPPPGFNGFASLGFGFKWKKIDLDFATATAWGKTKIGDEVARPVSYLGNEFTLCSQDQVVRTGCAGSYKVLTFWGSVSLTYRK